MGQSSSTSQPNSDAIVIRRKSEVIKVPTSKHYVPSRSNITALLNRLPSAIFPIIESFTSHSDIRNLLNTNKNAFENLKKEVFYLGLNRFYSLRYLEEISFQQKISKRISNPPRQLGLDLSWLLDFEDETLITPISVQRVIARKLLLTTLEYFRNVFDLLLDSFPNLIEVTGLYKIETLRIINASSLIKIDNYPYLQAIHLVHCPLLTDLTSIAHVPRIELNNCLQLEDLSCLSALHQVHVTIAFCPRVSIVSTLSNVRKVDLLSCGRIEDISALSTVYELTISECEKIRDLSPLNDNYSLVYKGIDRDSTSRLYPIAPSVIQHLHFMKAQLPSVAMFSAAKTLRLHSCPLIRSFTGLEGLHLVEVKGSTAVLDVSALATVHTVILDSCWYLSDISALGHVHTLKIDCCDQITSLIGLGQVGQQKIKISYCQGLRDFRPIQSVPFVQIIGCQAFHNPEEVQFCQTLFLERLPNVKDVSALSQVAYLKLAYLPNLTHLVNLKQVETVEIAHCEQLGDISGLGQNRRVEISECDSLVDISCLQQVPYVYLRNCEQICI